MTDLDTNVLLRYLVQDEINEYAHGNGDLADYLIGRINHLNGCDTTATFDHSLKNSRDFIVLG